MIKRYVVEHKQDGLFMSIFADRWERSTDECVAPLSIDINATNGSFVASVFCNSETNYSAPGLRRQPALGTHFMLGDEYVATLFSRAFTHNKVIASPIAGDFWNFYRGDQLVAYVNRKLCRFNISGIEHSGGPIHDAAFWDPYHAEEKVIAADLAAA